MDLLSCKPREPKRTKQPPPASPELFSSAETVTTEATLTPQSSGVGEKITESVLRTKLATRLYIRKSERQRREYQSNSDIR